MTDAGLLKKLLPPILMSLFAWIHAQVRTFIVRAQLIQHDRLHLACGSHLIAGWANIDLDARPNVVGWNLTRPLPIADRSIRYIYSEHFIEHIPLKNAQALLRECHRVLLPGGVLRLSTPDLAKLLREYADGRTSEWHDLGWKPETPCRMLNEGMREWGHCFLYDRTELERLLRESGFDAVCFTGWRESAHDALRGLESRPHHGELIVEASRRA